MCKEWPGARCASHTGAIFTAKQDATRKALKALRASQNALETALNNADTDAAYIASLQADVMKHTNKVNESKQEQQEAKEVWASTPGGLTSLSSQYTLAVKNGDEEEAEELLRTIKAGEEIKAYREEAQRIAAHAYRNAMNSPEDIKQAIREKQEQLDAAQGHLVEAHGGIAKKSEELDAARKQEVKAHSLARQSINKVKAAQESARIIIAQTYKDAGVPDGLAEHYSTDSIAGMQNGWEYLSSTPGDKFPRYQDEITVKTKASELSTYDAVQALANSKRYKDAQDKLAHVVGEYNTSIAGLKGAREHTQALDTELFNSVKSAEPESSSSKQLKEEIVEMKAISSTGLGDAELFSADFSRFVQSGYKNPDGSSNALVRLDDVGGGIPGYVQVDKVVRSKKNPHIILKNGIKIPVEELKTAAIKLVAPQKGATKLVKA